MQRVNDAAAWWRTCGEDKGYTTRTDLDPVLAPKLLPHLALLDAIGNGTDWRYRLVGEHVSDHTNRRLVGTTVSAFIAQYPERTWLVGIYDAVTQCAAPQFIEINYTDIRGVPRQQFSGIFPLHASTKDVAGLLICAVFVKAERALADSLSNYSHKTWLERWDLSTGPKQNLRETIL